MTEYAVEEKEWVLIKYAHAIVRPLGGVGVLFGLTVLAGYFGSVEILYRPMANGPATHPLTAMCIVLIALGLQKFNHEKVDKWLHRLPAFLVLILTSVVIIDVSIHSQIHHVLTPFQGQVLADLQAGKSNSMGMNSAFMFFCISISLALYSFQKFVLSQFVAFFAIAIPDISIIGYAYKLGVFHGQMSVVTAASGFMLATASLGMTAHIGGLKALLSPYLGGKIARLQVLAGYLVPTLLGVLLLKSQNSSEGSSLGIFVVLICWFIILMTIVSAIFQEKVDRLRRKGEQRLKEKTMSDPLTGLSNRRKFHEFGQEEINRVIRNKSQFWLLILDIDHFKKINDAAGHDIGDRVIIKLGATLKESVRAVDLVSRIGGEEFTIILVDSSKQGAALTAERIQMNIKHMKVDGWTDGHGPITASIGCAINNGSCALEETFKLADEALYKAKENGRNRVVFSDTDVAHQTL